LKPADDFYSPLTEIIAVAASDPSYLERTWVLITESPEGGWGIGSHATTKRRHRQRSGRPRWSL